MSSLKLPVALILGALGASAVASAEVKVGDSFVELDNAKTAAGKTFHLKDLSGKWVLYSFNASWCGPCKKELPAWDKLAPKFGGKVLFVAVNIDNESDAGKKFIDELKLKHLFPVFMPDEKSSAMKEYDPAHMPSSFVMDPKGIIRHIELGYDKGDEDKLSAKLTELLGA